MRNKEILSLFTTMFLFSGKFSIARANRLYFDVLFEVKKRVEKDPRLVIRLALDAVKPTFELRSKKIAGNVYRIPSLLSLGRRYSFAVRFLVQAANKRTEETFQQKLAAEIVDAYFLRGFAYKLKEELNREVNLNRPFLRFLQKK